MSGGKLNTVRGFTLIETLVVVVLVSIVVLGSYALLTLFNNTDQVLERRAELLRRYSMAMYRIDDDLRQLTARPVKNAYNGYEPALRGDTDEIEFTRVGAANLTGEPRGELQRAGYSLGFPEDDDSNRSAAADENGGALLLRSRWRVLDRAPDSEPVVEPLLAGVESLNFRYFDPRTNAWLAQWPPLNERSTAGQVDNRLPSAIELVLVSRDGGELRRVFNLLQWGSATNTGGGNGGNNSDSRNDAGRGKDSGSNGDSGSRDSDTNRGGGGRSRE
ncbi:type II secretion system minor pseudopilin GspJ [Microbulbifer sp. SAOS-129_SWC]|uniref:type II secretion system minor pseudopilin GspJ n=1 Tax=Microbulbifer sp. SAOS-129_SWC TaxID=3145235 RepID=UPI003216CD9C